MKISKHKTGKTATLLTLATLLILGISSFTSSVLVKNNKNTLLSKAEEYELPQTDDSTVQEQIISDDQTDDTYSIEAQGNATESLGQADVQTDTINYEDTPLAIGEASINSEWGTASSADEGDNQLLTAEAYQDENGDWVINGVQKENLPAVVYQDSEGGWIDDSRYVPLSGNAAGYVSGNAGGSQSGSSLDVIIPTPTPKSNPLQLIPGLQGIGDFLGRLGGVKDSFGGQKDALIDQSGVRNIPGAQQAGDLAGSVGRVGESVVNVPVTQLQGVFDYMNAWGGVKDTQLNNLGRTFGAYGGVKDAFGRSIERDVDGWLKVVDTVRNGGNIIDAAGIIGNTVVQNVQDTAGALGGVKDAYMQNTGETLRSIGGVKDATIYGIGNNLGAIGGIKDAIGGVKDEYVGWGIWPWNWGTTPTPRLSAPTPTSSLGSAPTPIPTRRAPRPLPTRVPTAVPTLPPRRITPAPTQPIVTPTPMLTVNWGLIPGDAEKWNCPGPYCNRCGAYGWSDSGCAEFCGTNSCANWNSVTSKPASNGPLTACGDVRLQCQVGTPGCGNDGCRH